MFRFVDLNGNPIDINNRGNIFVSDYNGNMILKCPMGRDPSLPSSWEIERIASSGLEDTGVKEVIISGVAKAWHILSRVSVFWENRFE